AVLHAGTQYVAGAFWEGGEPGEIGYRNHISAIRHATPYRSPRRTPRPIMAGVMPAMIDAPDDYNDRAVLDAEGRYKVVANFDMAADPTYQHSGFIRMAQPYAGTKAGLHFPLARGTEVALGWEDGDPDRPIILGAAPHSRTISPVTSRNQTENRIQTLAGTALIMNDGTPAGATAAPVYLSMQVPVPEAAPPDYLRMGDVPTADARVEQAILATPVFGAGVKCGRPPELAPAAYAGIMSFTPDQRTITTGKSESCVIGGNYNANVGGWYSEVITGPFYQQVFAPGGTISHIVQYGLPSASGAGFWDTRFKADFHNTLSTSFGTSVTYNTELRYAVDTSLSLAVSTTASYTHYSGWTINQ
ncbi:phage baseplate assembly protein V, partial [Inquilinus sp. CA228]|uniref:phage baseplate assembly protein V n=1 Tax=Inquilinus sp. CA228 TaxID=3455609 RepID=UPI003F8D4F29